ncbi:hypothetical protein niasHT_026177 [Heterodera trifolii]|uniref:Uncharacterized protein n=1 Tax=Heterodera trifolii TaxID=157864 RepID=A0ABD2K1M4_9BILA
MSANSSLSERSKKIEEVRENRFHRSRSVCSTPGTPSSHTTDEQIRFLAVDGCNGCSKLVDKTTEIRRKWKDHCVTEVKREQKKVIEHERKAADDRVKNLRQQLEEEKQQLKDDLTRRDKEIENLREELDYERKKRQQVEDENTTKDCHLTRAKALIERCSFMRVDAFELIEQLVVLLEEQEKVMKGQSNCTTNDNGTNKGSCRTEAATSCATVATTQLTKTTYDRQKKYQEIGIQTVSCQLNDGESPTKTGKVKDWPVIGKLVKRIAHKHTELSEAVEHINKLSVQLEQGALQTVQSSAAAEREKGGMALCNGEPPSKRSSRTVSSPVEDPAPHLQLLSPTMAPTVFIVNNQHNTSAAAPFVNNQYNNSTDNYNSIPMDEDDDDDDDIQVLEVLPRRPPPPIMPMPSTPPLPATQPGMINGSFTLPPYHKALEHN